MATPNTKIVNIKATIPIRDTTPPIYGVKTNVKMTHSDILKCLCRRAIVEEVLPDGSTVRLTTKNFRDDFSSAVKPVKKEIVKKAAPKTIEDIDLAAQLDDPDDNDNNEPEEAKNVNTTLNFIDGTTIEKTGIDPDLADEEDETYDSEAAILKFIDGTIIDTNVKTSEVVITSDESAEDNSTEEAEGPVVNTISTPIDTSVKKRNSRKTSRKK